MADIKVGSWAVKIDPAKPTASAANLTRVLLPAVFAAASTFDTKRGRVEFMGALAAEVIGWAAAEMGKPACADQLEVVAKELRDRPYTGRRPH